MSTYGTAKPLSILIMALVCVSVPTLKASDLCSNDQSPASVQFQLYNGGIVIPVQINDYQKQLNFLLDTGAEISIIDKQLSQRLGLPAESEVTLLKPEAEALASLVHVRELRVGSLTLRDQSAISDDKQGLSQALGVHLDGTLGLNVLEQIRFKIDYSNTTVTLCPSAKYSEDPKGSAVQLIRSGGLLLVPVTFNDSIQDHLCLDTGSNFTNLSWNAWQRITENWHPREIVSGLRASGESEAQSYLTRLDSIQVGKMRVSRPAVVVTKPQTTGTLAQATFSGLLGHNELKRFILTIDLPDNQLFLRPDPKYHPNPLRYTTVGIQAQKQGTTFLVASVWDNSPASKAGIRIGDEILKIDGKALDPVALGALSGHLLHRPEGTPIHLQLRREGQTFERTLVCRNLLP